MVFKAPDMCERLTHECVNRYLKNIALSLELKNHERALREIL